MGRGKSTSNLFYGHRQSRKPDYRLQVELALDEAERELYQTKLVRLLTDCLGDPHAQGHPRLKELSGEAYAALLSRYGGLAIKTVNDITAADQETFQERKQRLAPGLCAETWELLDSGASSLLTSSEVETLLRLAVELDLEAGDYSSGQKARSRFQQVLRGSSLEYKSYPTLVQVHDPSGSNDKTYHFLPKDFVRRDAPLCSYIRGIAQVSGEVKQVKEGALSGSPEICKSCMKYSMQGQEDVLIEPPDAEQRWSRLAKRIAGSTATLLATQVESNPGGLYQLYSENIWEQTVEQALAEHQQEPEYKKVRQKLLGFAGSKKLNTPKWSISSEN